MNTAFDINFILSCVGSVIYIGSAAWIFRQSYHGGVYPRARRALSALLLMWGVFAAACAFDDHLSGTTIINNSLMSVATLLIGGFSMVVTLLYPFEIARPGWTTVRNVIRLTLPFALLTGFYFLMLAIFGEPVRTLTNTDELFEHLGEFNVWFRFVLFLAVCLYLAHLFLSTSISALRFHKLSIGDNTPVDPHQASWLRTYAIGQSCIAVCYFILLLNGNIWVQIAHRSVALVFFCVVIYMVGFSASQNPISTTRK